MRIVIDTNIWVSGLLWRGKPWQLIRLAEEGVVENCISYQILLELGEVLEYERLQQRLTQLQLTSGQAVAFALNISKPFEISRSGIPIVKDDPDDDIFILTALAAQATYVVSNDSHLLNLKFYEGVEIIGIDAFMKREFNTD